MDTSKKFSIQVTPSSGDQRHGFVRIIDNGAGSGMDLEFFDTVMGETFNGTLLDLNLAYDALHTLGIEIEFVDDLAVGALGEQGTEGNDIVKIIVDGQVVHCGTFWESFYADPDVFNNANDHRRIQSVDRLLVGHSGPGNGTVAAQLNGGLYFDNVLVTDLNPIPSVPCPGENEPPVCDDAVPTTAILWPPNHTFAAIQVDGITDPDGDAVTITIDSISQDEPVDAKGSGHTAPDGLGVGTSTAEVRAERVGSGNGRFYHIGFTADDGNGSMCSGVVLVGMPKSQGKNGGPVDEGALYDSTVIP